MELQKPFATYLGGKESEGVYQFIINHIPPHKTFISGFLGNCAILRHKKPAKENIGIDANVQVIDRWKNIYQKKNNFTFINSFFENFVCLMNENFYSTNETFIFLDPPYLHNTRKSPKVNRYKFEMNESDHFDLLSSIDKLNCKISITCYENSIYKNKLKNWNKTTYKSQTRKGQVIETLYYNYTIDALHEYTYLGSNCWDRQRIKRKIERWTNKLKALPILEQQAILKNLLR